MTGFQEVTTPTGPCERRATPRPSRRRAVGRRDVVAVARSERVLFVEHRDEVFAALRPLFTRRGFVVQRVESARAIWPAIQEPGLALLLIYDDLPGESGWLATAKLRLARHQLPVWLYTAPSLPADLDWRELSGASEVITYGGQLHELETCLSGCLHDWVFSRHPKYRATRA